MHKVAVIGATLSGNKGAAAMLESTLLNLPQVTPVERFYVLSIYPKADRQLNDNQKAVIVPATPLQLVLSMPLTATAALLRLVGLEGRWLLKHPVIRALNNSELLIDLSGISFADGRHVELIYNAICILPAILLDKPVIKYAQAMGPFRSYPNRWLATWLLPKVTLIIARGADTYEYLTSLGLKNIALCADAAFALPEPKTDDIVLALEDFVDRQVVGISPSSVVNSYTKKQGLDYVSEMTKFVNQLIRSGYSVRLIAHAYRQSKNSGRTSDAEVCQAIYEKVEDKDACELVVGDYSANTLRAIIGKSDFFIASRFHAMVSSLATGIPTLVTSWGHKYGEVLAMFDLREWTLSHRALNSSLLWAKFQDLVIESDEIRDKIQQRLPEVKKSSRNNAHLTAELLNR